MKIKSHSDSDIISQALSEGLELFLAIQPVVKPSMFWELCLGVVGWCVGAVYLTSLGRPTDIGLQLGKACYPCSG